MSSTAASTAASVVSTSNTGDGTKNTKTWNENGALAKSDSPKDIKTSHEKYSFFISTAHQNPVDERSGTGDVDYASALEKSLNVEIDQFYAQNKQFARTTQAHYIRGLFTEKEIFDFVTRHKSTSSPILHIMINPPCTGFTFTPEGLAAFKKTGVQIIISVPEFIKAKDKSMVMKISRYLSVADEVIFFEEIEKNFAIGIATDSENQRHVDQTLIYNLTKSTVIPVPPTVPVPRPLSHQRGKDILCFGMIRKGKGLAHVIALAELVKTEGAAVPQMKDKKILVVGTVCEQDDGAREELERLMLAVFPSMAKEITGKSCKDLKDLLKNYQAQEKTGSLKPAIPLEIHLDVPVEQLQPLFSRCTYSFLPMHRGPRLVNSSIVNSIAQELVTYSHKRPGITPEILISGKYAKAMVIMPNDQYDAYASSVCLDIFKRELDPKLNAGSQRAARAFREEVLAPDVVAKKHLKIYQRALNLPHFAAVPVISDQSKGSAPAITSTSTSIAAVTTPLAPMYSTSFSAAIMTSTTSITSTTLASTTPHSITAATATAPAQQPAILNALANATTAASANTAAALNNADSNKSKPPVL